LLDLHYLRPLAPTSRASRWRAAQLPVFALNRIAMAQ
jgi:hypothetical protein